MTADRLQDPVFKQSYGFAREGETLRIEISTEPGGGVRAEHVHPVLEGETMITLDGEASRLGPGGRVVVPPGAGASQRI